LKGKIVGTETYLLIGNIYIAASLIMPEGNKSIPVAILLGTIHFILGGISLFTA